MPNTVQLTQNGQPVYPVTDVSLITGLEERSGMRVIPYTTRPTASAETAGFIYMDESTLDLYITKATSGSYSWVSAGNLSNIDLDNCVTKTEFEQLDGTLNGIDLTITEAGTTSESGRWTNNNGIVGPTTSGVLHRAAAISIVGMEKIDLTTYMSWAAESAAFLCNDSGAIIETIPRLPSPGDPTVITDKIIPNGATKIYINFASAFTFHGFAPGIFERLEEQIQEAEAEIIGEIDGKVDVAVDAAIDEYQKEYGAVEIVENSTPIPLTENDFVLGNLNNNGVEISANNVIRSDYIRVVPGANYTFSTVNNYRCRIYCFDKDKNYIINSSIPWQTGTYQGIIPLNADYIRILVASPAGTTTAPVWANIGLSFTVAKVYQYGRAAAERQIETALEQYFNIELPILGPSPQKPANNESDSDINAETMTSTDIQAAIESVINKLPVANKYYWPNNPRYGTIYGTIGRDASNQYDIKAYVFTKRNRMCWRTAAALYAWKNGSTIIYSDHRSPIIGDIVYSNTTRTQFGTVASYNSATPAITVGGTQYVRDDSAKIAADDIFTASELSSGTTQIAAYRKDGTVAGTATVTTPTTLTLNSKTYTRYSSGDYHTDNKATIVLWGNEHGPQSDPNEPSIILYRLVKDLCNGCVDNQFITYLRGYCKLVIIPAANPYGVNLFASTGQEGRNNANGVNINRNYDTAGWGIQTDVNKGNYAGDQPETQFIMNTVLDVDADVAIDIHCLGYVTSANDGRSHFEGAVSILNEKVERVMNGFCGLSYTSYGSASPTTKATGADWLYSLGIAGGLIEMNAGPCSTEYDGQQHSDIIMFADYTLLLNTLRMWYYTFDTSLDLSRMSIK